MSSVVVDSEASIVIVTEGEKYPVTVSSVGVQGPEGPEGPDGPIGPEGPEGPPGPAGVGVPTGGTTGQILAKASNADYDDEWINAPSSAVWGSITGTITNQTDLINYLAANYFPLSSFTSSFNSAFASKTTTDLAEGANLYFTNSRVIAALPDQASNNGKFLQTDGTNLSWQAASSLDLVSYSYSGGL